MELQNTSLNVEEQNKQDYLNNLKIESIENTPFSTVSQTGEHFGAIGKHKITESFKTIEELKEELTKMSWDRIVQVVWAITEIYNKSKNE